MSIVTKNGVKFSFKCNNNLETIAPEGSKIYVMLSDNCDGTHSVSGRVLNMSDLSELGWTASIGSMPSDTSDLLKSGHSMIISKLMEMNVGVNFESTLP